jgi:small subunit ribosomal protein S4
LQTIVHKKKLARTTKQARQFITHRHILVNGIVVDAPGYIVPVADENAITFIARSPLFSELHPERAVIEKAGSAAEASKASAQIVEESKEAATEEIPAVEIAVEDAEEQ